jgi:hypothetical protein
MSMNLEDLTEHVARVRLDLESKKRDLPLLLFRNPELAMAVRYQIECLEPRLRELERAALRLGKEQSARTAAVPV